MIPNTQLMVVAVSLSAAASAALFAWLTIRFIHTALDNYRQRFETRADGAKLDLVVAGSASSATLFKWSLLSILAVGVLTWLAVASIPLAAVAMAATAFAPWALLRSLRRRRLERIEEQLPPLLLAVASNMKAGVALAESLKQVQSDFPPPLSQEIFRVLQEQQVGKSLDEALENLGRRVPLASMNLAISAIRIAANVGGQISETLERLAATLRTKRTLERRIGALTGQGRAQAWVMGAMPVVLALALSWVVPEDMKRLFTTSGGYTVLGFIAVLETLGMWWIRKIVAIDV